MVEVQVWSEQMPLQKPQSRVRHIGAAIALTSGSKTEQQEPCTTADFEDPLEPQRTNAADSRFHPGAHFPGVYQLTGVAALPPSDIKGCFYSISAFLVGFIE